MRRCTVSGCERSHWARGWCRLHYQRWQRNGAPDCAAPRRSPISPRQREILLLIAQGYDAVAAGRALYITKSTVHMHLQRARDAFDVHTAAALVARAIFEGIITREDVLKERTA